MLITKKNQYALRATFELAKHYGQGPIKIQRIAETQAIPGRFLEIILVELKKGGFVKSVRGVNGGYSLVIHPANLYVGALMRYLSRDIDAIECTAPIPEANCPFKGQCAFFPMWDKVTKAIFEVYDCTTLQDLLDCERGDGRYPLAYNGGGDPPL